MYTDPKYTTRRLVLCARCGSRIRGTRGKQVAHSCRSAKVQADFVNTYYDSKTQMVTLAFMKREG